MVLSKFVEDNPKTAHQSEAVFQPDQRAAIEPEEVFGQVAEVALPEWPREPVRHAKRALETGKRTVVGRLTMVKSGCEDLDRDPHRLSAWSVARDSGPLLRRRALTPSG